MKLSIPFFFLSLLAVISCADGEREQAQQEEYEMQLQQQMIRSTDAFRSDVEQVLGNYFELKEALAADEAEEAAAAAGSLTRRAGQVDAGGLDSETAVVWSAFGEEIQTEAGQIEQFGDIEEQRRRFENLSEAMIQVVDVFRPAGYEIFVKSCPMVRGGSAGWLSRGEQIRNPYHGERMLNCGEVIRRI